MPRSAIWQLLQHLEELDMRKSQPMKKQPCFLDGVASTINDADDASPKELFAAATRTV